MIQADQRWERSNFFVLKMLYVLYCTVLYCTVLYCTVLYCTVLYILVWKHSLCSTCVQEIETNNIQWGPGRTREDQGGPETRKQGNSFLIFNFNFYISTFLICNWNISKKVPDCRRQPVSMPSFHFEHDSTR